MRESSTHQQIRRSYRNHFLAAVAVYALVIWGSLTWLRAHPTSSARAFIALLPMLPIVYGLYAWVRLFRRLDELHRRVHLEALALAFGGTAMFVLTWGFLETAGFARISAWWTWVVMSLLWLVGMRIAGRRYR